MAKNPHTKKLLKKEKGMTWFLNMYEIVNISDSSELEFMTIIMTLQLLLKSDTGQDSQFLWCFTHALHTHAAEMDIYGHMDIMDIYAAEMDIYNGEAAVAWVKIPDQSDAPGSKALHCIAL